MDFKSYWLLLASYFILNSELCITVAIICALIICIIDLGSMIEIGSRPMCSTCKVCAVSCSVFTLIDKETVVALTIYAKLCAIKD